MSDTFLLLLAYFVASAVFGGILAMVLVGSGRESISSSELPQLKFRYRALERKYHTLENQKQALVSELSEKISELRQKLEKNVKSKQAADTAIEENELLKEKLATIEQVKNSLTEKIAKQTEAYQIALQEAQRSSKQNQIEVISLKAEIGRLKVQLSSLGHFERSIPSTNR